MRHAAVAFALLALMATPSLADETLAYAAVYPSASPDACGYANGIVIAQVVVTNSIPMSEISFSAPLPDCFGNNATVILEESPYATTGDSQNGVTVDLGGCVSSPVTVLTIYVQNVTVDNPNCCFWPVTAFGGLGPGSNVVPFEFVDCDGATRTGDTAVRNYIDDCCGEYDVLTAYEPDPANGATGVPTDVTLSWLLPDERCDEWIYMTTLPYPPGSGPRPGTTDYFTEYQPSPELQPNTTYYWMIGLQCTYDISSRSDLWSFTTGDGPVPTESSTWGRVKALYQ